MQQLSCCLTRWFLNRHNRLHVSYMLQRRCCTGLAYDCKLHRKFCKEKAHLALHCCTVMPGTLGFAFIACRKGDTALALPMTACCKGILQAEGPPCPALLCCSARQASGNAAPLTAMDQELVMQGGVFFVSPGLPCDGGVQVPLPPPHALLISPPLGSTQFFMYCRLCQT